MALGLVALHLSKSLLRKNLTLVDPHFASDRAVDGVSRRLAVVDICADRVKRDLSDLVAFSTSDFRSAQSSGDLNLDSSTVHPHDASHCLPHGSSMADSLLELLANVLGDE